MKTEKHLRLYSLKLRSFRLQFDYSMMALIITLSLFGCGCSHTQSTDDNNDSSSVNSDTADLFIKEFQEFKDIKAKADNGDIEGQYWLAICYNRGLYGCKIDKPLALNQAKAS
jgi:hypothetical protein